MKYRIELTEEIDEDIVILAKEKSAVLEKIEALLACSPHTVFGYTEDDIVKLEIKNVYCFFSEDGRVYAMSDGGRFQVRERLYQLEELCNESFIKINQSCLVNASKIKRFNSSFGGALLVVLENGYKDYVSRRQVKTVKERVGL